MSFVLGTHKHWSESSAGQAVFGASLRHRNTKRQERKRLESEIVGDRSKNCSEDSPVLREPPRASISVQSFIAAAFITISDTDLRGD